MEETKINNDQAKIIASFIYSNLDDYISSLKKEYEEFLEKKINGGKEENEKN